MNEDINLGGNIQLSGFKVISKTEFVIVKKIIGSYARKFSDNLEGYENLKINIKEVHKSEGSRKFEIHAMLEFKGKIESTKITEKNIFVGIDAALKKLESAVM